MDERHAYWFAALVDGEGSILIMNKKGRINPVVYIFVAQNDRRLLDRAIEYVGSGKIYEGMGPRKNGCQLQICRRADVLRILREIEPFLVLKGEKARRGIEILE